VTDLSLAPLIVWAAGISTLISLGTTLWHMMTSGARTNSRLIAEHAHRLELLERKTERHDDHIERMPSHQTIHRLELTLARLAGDLGKIDERLKPVASIAERLQEMMIEQAKGR
jgi:hypothetical protein